MDYNRGIHYEESKPHLMDLRLALQRLISVGRGAGLEQAREGLEMINRYLLDPQSAHLLPEICNKAKIFETWIKTGGDDAVASIESPSSGALTEISKNQQVAIKKPLAADEA